MAKKCQVCGRRLHYENKTGYCAYCLYAKEYDCSVCGQKITRLKHLESGKCDKCYNAEYNAEYRKDHHDTYHGKNPYKNRLCEKCGQNRCRNAKSNLCRDCYDESFLDISGLNKYERKRKIRSHAQSTAMKLDIQRVCVNCGYDKHAEVCHIRPVSDFPENATLLEINSPDNLTTLCPNCHWEFDQGMISLDKSKIPQ